MGVYAETDFEITCENEASAKKVKQELNKLKKSNDKFGNFDFQELKSSGEMVFGKHSSGRVQNLEYQCEEMWAKIKDIKGVLEATFPFLIEGDGCYFSNENN